MPFPISNLLEEQQIVLDLATRQMPVALDKIVRALAANGKIENAEKFLEQLLAREQAKPSAVENGVAFPHVRTDLVDEIVIGIGRGRSGIPFGEGTRARLVFVIGVPQQMVNDYLICIGTLARLLRDDARRAALLAVGTAREFIDTLTADSGTI